jgi:hypothetical protein
MQLLASIAGLDGLVKQLEGGIIIWEAAAGLNDLAQRATADLAQKALFLIESTAPIDPVRAASGSRSAIPPASPCSGRGARFGIDEPEAARAR